MKFSVDLDVPLLWELLACQVHGTESAPTLMISFPNSTLEKFNLQMYKVLGTEPLHDIPNLVKNLYKKYLSNSKEKPKEVLQT